MNRIAKVLGLGFTAELMSLAACWLGLIGINRPWVALAGLVAGLLALVPLGAFGRQRYCITGLFIAMLALASFALFLLSWFRYFVR